MLALHFNQIIKQDVPRTMLNSHNKILQTLSESVTPSFACFFCLIALLLFLYLILHYFVHNTYSVDFKLLWDLDCKGQASLNSKSNGWNELELDVLWLAYVFCSWGEIEVRTPRQCIIHPILSVIQQIFTEFLLHARDCARCLIYDNEQKRHDLCPHEPQRDTQPINKYTHIHKSCLAESKASVRWINITEFMFKCLV